MKIRLLALCTVFFLFVSCAAPPKVILPFDFNHPAEVTKLPNALHEISGISFYKKNELACVQDEKGIIYYYNIKKDKLRKAIQFGNDKDYEGITNVNDTVYVLCSNGVISEVDSTKESGLSNIYNTFLSKENNCEGLCYDKNKRRLLVACKGKPKKGTAARGQKAVYSFNLDTRELERDPVYVIEPDDVRKAVVSLDEGSFIDKYIKKGSDDEFLFEPSEIGIDPMTNDVYILSSVDKTLLAMTYEGKIKFAVHLDPGFYKQPEGLTFSKDGTMYISDEGKGGKANLIRITRNP